MASDSEALAITRQLTQCRIGQISSRSSCPTRDGRSFATSGMPSNWGLRPVSPYTGQSEAKSKADRLAEMEMEPKLLEAGDSWDPGR